MSAHRVLFLLVLLAAVSHDPCEAALITGTPREFSAIGFSPENGNPVSARAEFSIDGNILTVVLTNTTAGGTKAQGDALTGIVFRGDPHLEFVLTSIDLTQIDDSDPEFDEVFLNKPKKDVITQEVDGSWIDNVASPEWHGGAATTGFDPPGLFGKLGEIDRGGGGPDYGIVATGTFPGEIDGGTDTPFVQNSLTFEFETSLEADGNGNWPELNISEVGFLFGTSGPGLVEYKVSHAPEPASIVVWGGVLGIGLVGGLRRRRRRAG